MSNDLYALRIMDLKDFSDSTDTSESSSVALGFFDGVHSGHEQIINACVSFARSNGIQAILQTFTHFSIKSNKCIMTNEEKAQILKSLDVDKMVIVDFTKDVMNMSANDFCVNILLNELHAKCICVGIDYRFGHKKEGGIEFLKSFCARNSIELQVIETKIFGEANRKVSSQWLRDLLQEGDMDTYLKLTNERPYQVSGVVSHGKRLGRKLGFPTINLIPQEIKTIPRFGVYATRVSIEGDANYYYGVTNVGQRPTVDTIKSHPEETVETFVFDYEGDCYDKNVRVDFIKFLRPESKFDGLIQLKEAVEKDKEKAALVHGIKMP